DMGGTTAKASLVREGEPTLAPGYYVGGYASGHPVMLPMIDVVEVGAGGGSIAWRDEVGALKVGPQSAGADPGPICYRGGGTEPTITDANVVLGRLDPDNFLGGTMKLDAAAALRGIKEKIASPLQLDPIAAAQAIVEIANNKMSLAVREVSVAKGYDPRDFGLLASGGAGPLHVCAIARELYIPKVIVPLFPSHFSALGMLLADERHDFTRTVYSDLASVDFGKLMAVHDEMVKEARAGLRYGKDAQYQVHLDLRYVGQEFTLSVPVDLAQLKRGERKAIRTAFDQLYEHRYAHHSPEEPVEMVNIRLRAIGKRPKLTFPSVAVTGAATPSGERSAYFSSASKPVTAMVYRRDRKRALTSQNVGGVSHVGADLGFLVVDGMKRYGRGGFKPGDVIITNHQAVAGQHLNNVVIYSPYFYKGELLMFCMVRAHWIDVGGQSTGFGAGATVADPWLEGLQLDQLKIYEEGKLNETLYRIIKE